MRRPIPALHRRRSSGRDRPAGRDRAESFFATLECELPDRTRWATHAEGTVGGVHVHRRVAQHAAASFRVGLPVAAGFRTSPGDGARGRGPVRRGARTRGPGRVRRAGAGRRRHRRCCRKHEEGMMAHGRTARLRLREADNRREAASADRPDAGGAVDLPGPWTPAGRRATSADRRGGRPQAVGNLAGDRCRRRLRRGREIHTEPAIRGPVMMGTQASTCPRNRGNLIHPVVLMVVRLPHGERIDVARGRGLALVRMRRLAADGAPIGFAVDYPRGAARHAGARGGSDPDATLGRERAATGNGDGTVRRGPEEGR